MNWLARFLSSIAAAVGAARMIWREFDPDTACDHDDCDDRVIEFDPENEPQSMAVIAADEELMAALVWRDTICPWCRTHTLTPLHTGIPLDTQWWGCSNDACDQKWVTLWVNPELPWRKTPENTYRDTPLDDVGL